jgi:hypothetical protein
MPIFRSQGKLFYFAHIPKCGGTSVEAYLSDAFGSMGLKNSTFYNESAAPRWTKSSPQHVLWTQLSPMMPADLFDASFAIVRHPTARIVSAYNSFVADGVIRWHTFDSWLDSIVDDVTPRPYVFDQHGCRQVDFLPPDTMHFKLENRLADFLEFAVSTLGANADLAIPHLNITKTTDPNLKKSPMTTAQADRIHQIYAADYVRFDYDYDIKFPELYVPPQKPPRGIRTSLRRFGLRV